MGAVVNFFDRLTNVMSGKGTTADRRVYERYSFLPIDPAEAEAAYRSSWLVRKIVDVPPLDMTRAWRDWQAEGAIIEKLEAEEKRLQLKEKCKRALILARLYGGGALILGTNDADPAQPLGPGRIKAGGLTYVHAMSRWQLTVGPRRTDPADPWFGKPEYFQINSASDRLRDTKIHPSRVVEFIGQPAPEGSYTHSGVDSWFWGDPIMQSIGSAVKNADLAQDGFAALIDEAKIDILSIPDLTSLAATPDYEQKMLNRLQAAAMGKSTWRALMIDASEKWDQKQISWGGIPAIMDSFLLVVAGAADIPMTRLLGQSPKGLQSTGDGEERDYQSMITARQDEQLRPALDRIDEVLIPSALGSKPSDIYYVFGPLQAENEKDGATIEFQYAQGLKFRTDTGEFQGEVLAKAELNRMLESGRYPGLEKAIEDAANEGIADPAETQNEGDLQTLQQRVGMMEQRGQIAANDAARLLTDASPRSLYVSRKLLNADAVVKWAKAQGFDATVPAADMHVTVLFSRSPVDWMKMGSGWDQDADGKLKVTAGGARIMDKFGDAVVLLFSSSALSWRHEEMVRQGASHDFADYQPHVTITYDGGNVDLSKIEPYRGELIFGPEVFADVKEDWQSGVDE